MLTVSGLRGVPGPLKYVELLPVWLFFLRFGLLFYMHFGGLGRVEGSGF